MTTKLPQVMGLVFCEGFDVPTLALRGLLQARRFSKFPSDSPPIVVYRALYSRGLEGTIQLDCVRLETESVIFRHREWVNLPAGTVIHWMKTIERMIFPAPGRYSFKLLFDDIELTERFFEVMRDKS
jgi:hypothetical protein